MVKKKKASSFRGKVANDAIKHQKSGASYGYLMLPKKVSVFSPDPGGKSSLDFLPYTVTDPKHPDNDKSSGAAVEGSLWWKRPFSLHRNIGSGNEAVVCLSSVKKKCPICEFRAKRIKAGADKKETDDLKPKKRNLYIVIPLNSRKHEEVPHIFDMSEYLFQDLLTDELKENPDLEIFPDLEEGLTVKVRWLSSTMGNSKPFAEAGRIDFVERDSPYDSSILEDEINLDEVLKILSYEEIEALFLDDEANDDDIIDVDNDDEDDEEEDIPRRKKSLKPKKKVVDEDEDDEEDEEDDEDDEDDEPPKRKSKKITPKKKVVEEDEDDLPFGDDDDDDEDDEEPAPVKKNKKSLPSKKSIKTKATNVCPHKLKFGIDTDEYDVCDECDIWGECIAQKDKKK